MTHSTLSLSRNILLISILACAVFIGGMFLLHAVPIAARDKVADGLLFDFLITFPVLYYLIIIRPGQKSARRLFLVISICSILAYILLPQQQRNYILQVRKLSAAAELLFIVYAITKFRTLKKAYKQHQSVFADPIYNLRSALTDIMGDSLAAKIVASELAVLRYGLCCWRKEKSTLTQSTAFSTHKEFGYIGIWCMLIVAIMVEVTAFHLLLMRWSHTAAWILTSVSLYGLIFFIADLSAILKRKVLLNDEDLILRTGLRWQAQTTQNNISSIKKISNDYESDTAFFKGGIIKNSGNCLIDFKETVTINKLYGSAKEYSSILMHIDNFEGFANAIRERSN